jgi:NAD(P)-dependent dehydrogenase (short-subunit alcohol dehydrogenase family)
MALLTGRRMIVVGGSTGIGYGIADAWAAAGAEVVVCSRNPPADAEHLRWERIDLTEPDDACERLADLGAGRLDAACFSPVYYGEKRANFRDVSVREWHRQLEVNVTGLWLTLQTLLPSLREGGPGLFVGVSSEVAFNAGPGRSGYATSKAAAKSLLTRSRRRKTPPSRRRRTPSGWCRCCRPAWSTVPASVGAGRRTSTTAPT